MAELEAIFDDPEGASSTVWRYELPSNRPIRLGRSPDRADWHVDDSRVSAFIATVEWDGEQLDVKESEGRRPSKSWIFFRGTRETSFRVRPGESFVVGRTTFRLHGDPPVPWDALRVRGEATWVAVSPDGRRVAASTTGRVVHVWDAETGAELRVLSGHAQTVDCVAFSPDGAELATSSWDHTVRTFDANTGEPRDVIRGHTNEVNGVCYTADGTRILSASWDETAGVWGRETNKAVGWLRGHENHVYAVATVPGTDRALTASADGTCRVWDLGTREPVGVFGCHAGPVKTVAVSADGRRAVSASRDNTVRVWDLDTREPVFCHVGTHAFLTAAFSPDGQLVAAGWRDTGVLLLDATTGQVVARQSGHAARVWGVAFAPDGRTVYSASADGTVRRWEVPSGWQPHPAPVLVHWVPFELGELRGIAWSPDGRTVAGAAGNRWFAWSENTPAFRFGAGDHASPNVRSVAWSPDGTRLATASRSVCVWDVATGRELLTGVGHTGPVNTVAWSPDGRTLASASEDATVRLWGLDGSSRTVALHTAAVRGVAWSPDGRLVAAVSRHECIVFDPETGEAAGCFGRHLEPDGGELYAVAWLTNEVVVAAGRDREILRWRVGDGEPDTWRGPERAVRALAINPARTLLASLDSHGSLRLWDTTTGRCVCEHPVPVGERSGSGLAFHPTRPLLAAVCEDGKAMRVWDVGAFEPAEPAPEVKTVYLAATGPDATDARARAAAVLREVAGVRVAGAEDLLADPPQSDRHHRLIAGADLFLTVLGREFDGRTALPVAWEYEAALAAARPWLALAPPGGPAGPPGVRLYELAHRYSFARTYSDPDHLARRLVMAVGRWLEPRSAPPVPAGLKSVRVLEGGGEFRSLGWSANGRFLAAGGNRRVAVWDTADDFTLVGNPPGQGVVGIAWCPTRNRLAVSCDDGTAAVWSPASGTSDLLPPAPPSAHRPVAWSPDGEVLGFGSEDGRVTFLNAADMSELGRAAVSGPATAVAWAPAGGVVAVGGDGCSLLESTGGTFPVLDTGGRVYALAWWPDGGRLVTAGAGGALRVWDTATRRTTGTLDGHADAVVAVAVSPDGRLVASASWDDTVRLWDVARGAEAARLHAPSALTPFGGVAFSPDGRLLATLGSEGTTVHVWELDRDALIGPEPEEAGLPDGVREVGRTPEPGGQIGSLAWSPDGRFLAAGSDKHVVRVWDAEARRWAADVGQHVSELVRGVAWSPSGDRLASVATVIRVWGLRTGSELVEGSEAIPLAHDLQWSPDGRYLATAEPAGLIRVWEAATGRWVSDLTGHSAAVTAIVWLQNGEWLASTGQGGRFLAFERRTGRRLFTCAPVEGGITVAAKVGPSRVAVAGENGEICECDISSGREDRLGSHTARVVGLASSPGGEVLASLGQDDTLRLWHADGRNVVIAVAAGAGSFPRSLAFHPTRPVVAIVTRGNRAILFWELDFDRLFPAAPPPPRAAVWHVGVDATPAVLGVGDALEMTVRFHPDPAPDRTPLTVPPAALELTVYLEADGFHLDGGHARTVPLVNGRPAEPQVRATLTAVASGRHQLRAQVYAGRPDAAPPAAVTVAVAVAAPSAPPAVRELLDRRAVPDPAPDVTLFAAVAEQPGGGGHLVYHLSAPALGQDRVPLPPVPVTAADLRGFRREAPRAAADPDAAVAFGNLLFDRLFPPGHEARARYWQLQDAAPDPPAAWRWLVVADAPALAPWEMVAPYYRPGGGAAEQYGFLAGRFAVTHWVGGRGLGLAAEVPVGRIDLAHYHPPGRTLARWRDALGGDTAVHVCGRAGEVTLADPGSASYGLHVLRAGRGGPNDVAEAGGGGPDGTARPLVEARRLDVTLKRPLAGLSLADDRPPADRPPHPDPAECRLEAGWVLPLLHAGATAVAGPRWPVGGAADRLFWRTLLARLRAGDPLGAAAHAARLRVRDADPGGTDWLAFAAFGHPNCAPYAVRPARAFAFVEPLDEPPDGAYQPGGVYRFRATYRAEAPAWYEGRLRVRAGLLDGDGVVVAAVWMRGGGEAVEAPLEPVPGGPDFQCVLPVAVPDAGGPAATLLVTFARGEDVLQSLYVKLKLRRGGG